MIKIFQKIRKRLQAPSKLNSAMIELTRMKSALEEKHQYIKTFIEQTPTAIAMVDTNMCYLAVSKRWITDYKMEGKEFIGCSHYDLFPEIADDWKKIHQRCLKGAIDINEEEPFLRADGSLQWISWDLRPWYDSEGNIGGILMHTEDLTKIKEKEEEAQQIATALPASQYQAPSINLNQGLIVDLSFDQMGKKDQGQNLLLGGTFQLSGSVTFEEGVQGKAVRVTGYDFIRIMMILAGLLLTLVLSAAEPSANFIVMCAIIVELAAIILVMRFSLGKQ